MLHRGTSSRRRPSLLDQMQQVAEEQESADLPRSYHTTSHIRDDDDDGNDDDLFPHHQVLEADDLEDVDDNDDDVIEDDEMEMVRVLEMIDRGDHQLTIHEEEEITEEGDETMRSSMNNLLLDPLYEEGESEGGDSSNFHFDANDVTYYYEESQGSQSTMNDSDIIPGSPPGGYTKRTSFKALRQSVQSNHSSAGQISLNSFSTLPITTLEEEEGEAPLRVSGEARQTKKRSDVYRDVYRQSIYDSSSSDTGPGALEIMGGGWDSPFTSSGRGSKSRKATVRGMISRTAVFTSRRSSRRSSTRSSFTGGEAASATSGGGGSSSGPLDIASAVDRLGMSVSSGDPGKWESTIAAAAFVAASTNAPGNRLAKQYHTGEHVLVLLNLLNYKNRIDDPDDFTVSPVNECGYPEGAGLTEKQRQGPFHYLICTVTAVHFDEDERYYTVRRGDTGSEQRADPSEMCPISDEDAIAGSFKAAKRTRKTEAERSNRGLRTKAGPWKQFMFTLKQWPVSVYQNKMVPSYRSTRARAKVKVTNLLFGETGYAFKMKVTGINFLVMCSFFYLFNQVFTLSFLPPGYDYISAVVGLVVWIILFLELLFEGLIRPDNYRELRSSDKAYSPLTARNINTFHLCFESAALFLFVPYFPCIFNKDRCDDDTFFSGVYASMLAVTSSLYYKRLFGRIILGLTFLKVFGVVRHWKQMWLNNIFETDGSNSRIIRRVLLLGADGSVGKCIGQKLRWSKKVNDKEEDDDDDDDTVDEEKLKSSSKTSSSDNIGEDQDLKNAANIGTALMIVNSHRVLLMLLCVCVVFPSIMAIHGGNDFSYELTQLLSVNNLESKTTNDCDYLYNAAKSWVTGQAGVHSSQRYLIGGKSHTSLVWAQLLPVRCDWQTVDGVITNCSLFGIDSSTAICSVWDENPGPDLASADYWADLLNVRSGEMQVYTTSTVANLEYPATDTVTTETYYIKTINDYSITVQSTFRSLFFLELSMIMAVLFGLTVMREDAGRLVLDPLQRMLKIVVRYAENPLSQTLSGKKSSSGRKPKGGDDSAEELGSYETDQLINAIAKIADLLRKCWGVAGAGIISSNLARTKDGKTVVFNPTVPGKRVYALFGFVAIREFDRLLRALERDVMVLINDVARVVHDEVYRWSLGDSGQCNKNLGAAFLMVFRIGDFSEVHDRKKRATDVVFNSNLKGRGAKVKKRRGSSTSAGLRGSGRTPTITKFELGSNGGALQLASLPGIQTFTDRALLGLLKSYAGLQRDEKMVRWKDDFRLGAGVGAFSVSIIYGMDAGWAVEGAVGSEYKIDATYLSPHVNMASRMMSASKQYGVTILLSQAVEELLSKPARDKLRHLDTVIVKGASRPQRIFTYDARSEGTNFFLFDRPNDQADLDAEMYNPLVWDTDQDLKAMRQHINEPFMKKFKRGVDLYVSGEWKLAIQVLKEADNLMIQTVIEEGYVDADISEYGDELFDPNSTDEEIVRLRNHYGDGACKNLINYMQRRRGTPPADWRGFRALMSK